MPNENMQVRSNRLAQEKSPYLLQHKDNPVDWYPWGKEALNKAKEENKLLFISIGYSTCHWCHVMNRESFSDKEVANVINQKYIPIKVDREERPDIDKVYMSFAEAMTSNAGWPLNVIATPEGKPIHVGTYYPKHSTKRMIGIIELLNNYNHIWSQNIEKILEESDRILEEVRKIFENYLEDDIDERIFKDAKDSLKEIYDQKNGGFGSYPKFPMPQYLLYLLSYFDINNDEESLEIVEDSLIKMYKGGIFDHIGYGFFRYSVDEKWLVAHFEKMLYDNALMGIVYTKAYEITKKQIYRNVAEKIYDFIIRDISSAEGGFYSALDAESEGEEGKFYLFDVDEIINLLGEEDGLLFNKYFDITASGNFKGRNIPNLIGVDLEDIGLEDGANIGKMIETLFSYREKRVKPFRDEKILTSWNGLAIGSLAYGARVLGDELYLEKAIEAVDFILNNSIDEDDNLLSVHIGGKSYNLAYLEDYSFFIFALINLYKANKKAEYLDLAKKLTDIMLDLFGDKDRKGLYFYGSTSERLVLRPKEIYDGAIPSGNGFALINMMNLYILTKDEKYSTNGKDIIYAFGGNINKNPLASLYSLLAMMNFL